jgi:hypothetical protein
MPERFIGHYKLKTFPLHANMTAGRVGGILRLNNLVLKQRVINSAPRVKFPNYSSTFWVSEQVRVKDALVQYSPLLWSLKAQFEI